MANKTYAKEWMVFAYKNLATAKLLFRENHYEDIIGVELQQSLEKFIKALMANMNIKIPKDHDLVKLYFMIEDLIKLNEAEIVLLRIATNYYKDDRYPNPNYDLPAREEIMEVMHFVEMFFERVCEKVQISKIEIINAK